MMKLMVRRIAGVEGQNFSLELGAGVAPAPRSSTGGAHLGEETAARRMAGVPRNLPLALPTLRPNYQPLEPISLRWANPIESWPIYLAPIREGDGRGPITVLVHGAGYGSCKDASRIASGLTGAELPGEVHLLHWPTPSVAISAGAAYLGGLFSGAARGRATAAGVETAKAGQAQAEDFAVHLGRVLASLGATPERPLRLVGHSLGAHLLISALGNEHLQKLPIDEVVLLAGCTSAQVDVAQLERQGLKRLINVYSSQDSSLRTANGYLGSLAGTTPLSLGRPILQTEVLSLGTELPHDGYWAQLPAILRALGSGA